MDRQQILRLDGDDADGGPSSLLVFRLSTGIRIVVTEKGGAEASVLLSREQAEALVKKLSQSLGEKGRVGSQSTQCGNRDRCCNARFGAFKAATFREGAMHAPGWIELYTVLEEGREPSDDLVRLCMSGRTRGSQETMLHWYAIEGEPFVVRRLIELGFDVNARDSFGSSAIQNAAQLRRWDIVRVLREAGADRTGVDQGGMSYRSALTELFDEVPFDLRADAYRIEDLLKPGGPERNRVSKVILTRARLPAGSPGRPLERSTWLEFATQDPGLAHWDYEWFHAKGEGDAYAGDLVFWEDFGLIGAACVVVTPAADAALHVAHRVALHFGARVLFDFELDPAA